MKKKLLKELALVSDITLIDTLIIFEILANVNTFMEGGVKLFSYKKYSTMRDERGMTDYEVSKLSGVSTSTLSNWKAGRYTPKADKVKNIANVFKVSIEYFLEEAG